MPPNRTRSPARLLAPAALLTFVLAVALIVLGSRSPDEESKGQTTAAGERTTTAGRPGASRRPRKRPTYTVKPGDSLGRIGQRTGVQVETLQELNPSLDPQALVPGQKIKLRQ